MIQHYPKLPIENIMSVKISLFKIKADRHENNGKMKEYGWR